MKAFSATIVAVAASGATAFAPSSSNARASTSLNSHFSSIETKLFNKATLLKALNDMGIKTNAAPADGQQIEARGYKGETIMADIVIPQQNSSHVSGNILAADDLENGSGWQQSKQNWALPAVVG
jgi:hypothetical protein